MRQYAMVFNIYWLNLSHFDFQLPGTRGKHHVSNRAKSTKKYAYVWIYKNPCKNLGKTFSIAGSEVFVEALKTQGVGGGVLPSERVGDDSPGPRRCHLMPSQAPRARNIGVGVRNKERGIFVSKTIYFLPRTVFTDGAVQDQGTAATPATQARWVNILCSDRLPVID